MDDMLTCNDWQQLMTDRDMAPCVMTRCLTESGRCGIVDVLGAGMTDSVKHGFC